MRMSEQVRAKVKTYLDDVAAHLGDMSEQERRGLLRQLESHVHEALQARAGDTEADVPDLEAVLSEMDPPESYGQPKKRGIWGLSQGKWALLISIGGLVVASILVGLIGGRMVGWIPFFLFLGTQTAAFVLGVLSWRDPFGKAAVFTSAALTLFALLLCS